MTSSTNFFDPLDRRPIGRTGLQVTQIGFGATAIGGMYREVAEADAVAVVDHVVRRGIRHFDTAPLYGYGNAERRLGAALASLPRDEYVLSSKVGRLLVARDAIEPGMDLDRQVLDGIEDATFFGTPQVRPVFDYSYDGVMRSVEESLARLGTGRIDILYIHDPDDHWEQAISGAYPALERLRSDGVVRAIGAGMNQSAMLARFAREGDFDVFLVAGRYTLLDQEALAELLPICERRGISVVIGGVLNSGILGAPGPAGRFNYAPAPPAIVERASALRAVCDRHGVSLKAAAIQFVLAHPAVASVLVSNRTSDHLDEMLALTSSPIPDALWADLRAARLIPDEAPTP